MFVRILEIVRLVWINLIQNKFKVALTSVGIIAGAATIVLVIAIGRGGQADVADQFKNLNAGAIEITYEYSGQSTGGMPSMGGGGMPSMGGGGGMPSMGGGGGMPSMGGGGMPGGMGMMGLFGGLENTKRIELTETDVEDLELFVPGISDITISASTSTSVTGEDLEEETTYTVAAVKENYMDISNLSLLIGDFITESDEEAMSRVAVLGYDTAEEIFGSAYEAFNNILYVDERPYTVIGVLQQIGTVSSEVNPDTAIFLPYQVARKYIIGSNSISPTITAVAEEVKDVEQIIEDIELVLGQTYTDATFTITDAGTKMEAASASSDTLTMLLYAIATIVFFIGGIGIMNVLFVSVKERTQEIGVLKALGSSQQNILTEFLMEAAMISVFGGIVGVILASACMPLVTLVGMRVEPSTVGALLALVFAVLTGTIFGFYPAFKASKLLPVEALKD